VSIVATASRSGSCLARLDILVLAGGLGTRVRPVLGDTPKLLASLGGRPYLDHLLDWLRGFGARRVVLGLGHRAEAVVDHIKVHPRPDLTLSYVIEPSPLGTAGAVRFARRDLHSAEVLVINGDSFADADLCGMVTRQQDCGASGTILCTEVQDAGRYGRIRVDDHGYVEAFIEKDPSFHGPALVNAGVYLLSAALLDQIAASESTSLERDVFARLPPRSLAAFTDCSGFIDIGTPASLAQAAALFAERTGAMHRTGSAS
jgi:NDP-sugar pyrophosphorylase family protein